MSWFNILKNNSGLIQAKVFDALSLTSKAKVLQYKYQGMGFNKDIIREGVDGDGPYSVSVLEHDIASMYEVFNRIIEEAEKKGNQKDIEEGKKAQQLLKEAWEFVDREHDIEDYFIDVPNWKRVARTLPSLPVTIKHPTDEEYGQPKTYDSAPEVSSVVSQYFKMYKAMGKGIPTVQDIEEEEGRMLTEKEIEYYQFFKERLQ